jgi:hypothetical protein
VSSGLTLIINAAESTPSNGAEVSNEGDVSGMFARRTEHFV